MPRRIRSLDAEDAFTYRDDIDSSHIDIQSFKRRQQEDYRRFKGNDIDLAKRKSFNERYNTLRPDSTTIYRKESNENPIMQGEEAWENSEGERLEDFGVDQDVEFYDEDNVALSQLLLRNRHGKTHRAGYRIPI